MLKTLILNIRRYELKIEIALRPPQHVNQTMPVEIDCERNDLV